MHLTHHFTPGLRFDTSWKYRTLTPSGRTHWAHLPLMTDAGDDADPTGAWWCSRRCVAVLLRRPWQAMQMRCGLPAQPSADEVVQTLGQWLPGWQVAQPFHAAQAPVSPCAWALDQGGSALLLLQPSPRDRHVRHQYWAWVVGMERQERQRRAPRWAAVAGVHSGTVLAAGMRPHPRVLLTVPFGWSIPWASGYTARLRMHGPGQCHVDGIDGQRSESRCLAAITLTPPSDSGCDAPHAAGPVEQPPSKESD